MTERLKKALSLDSSGEQGESNSLEWIMSGVAAKARINESASELTEVSHQIWANPELYFKEVHAHKVLTDFLENQGFEVTRNYHLDTAFRATYGSSTGVHVGVICEYDALPDIGHACGHNLIAMCGAAAGLGIKAALELPENKHVGKVTVLGTPAEEEGGGKIKLIEAGAFQDMDVAMMAHPYQRNISRPVCLNLVDMKIAYSGRAAHAAAAPWEGHNALDAAVMCYANISVMRQQFKPDWRVHGTFLKAGGPPAIIPEESELFLNIRTSKIDDMSILKDKIIACAKGAAVATECEIEYSFQLEYADMITNPTLASVYEAQATKLGIAFIESERTFSTDMGNVSYHVPSIHTMFEIGTTAANHSRAFTAATDTPEAQAATLLQAKALALTGLELMQPGKKKLLEKIKKDFRAQVKKDSEPNTPNN